LPRPAPVTKETIYRDDKLQVRKCVFRAGTAAHPQFRRFVKILKIAEEKSGGEEAPATYLPRDFQTSQAAPNRTVAAWQLTVADGLAVLNYSRLQSRANDRALERLLEMIMTTGTIDDEVHHREVVQLRLGCQPRRTKLTGATVSHKTDSKEALFVLR
jgi:hypothetical protein